ncbi:hypothetical protein BB561_004493 [Smittium simulii]|uniref:Uncharacterized protein n=1 Tax=Smittium simulii TaxID=133385 RepID=A0A2T9YG30_9FUNG|nr:hypothetical protein BB561_004493 [Smittium simulii]
MRKIYSFQQHTNRAVSDNDIDENTFIKSIPTTLNLNFHYIVDLILVNTSIAVNSVAGLNIDRVMMNYFSFMPIKTQAQSNYAITSK